MLLLFSFVWNIATLLFVKVSNIFRTDAHQFSIGLES